MVTITYFVHGTTFDNENDLCAGWLPGELSPLGLEQSHTLAKQVADKQFDAVFCSDLKRAVDTAAIAFGQNVIQDERLREANYGDWNGAEEHVFKPRMAEYVDQPFPNGESYRDVETRMRALCEELKQNYDGKHVAFVAHQAPQLALEVIANGKTWEQAIAEDWRKTGAYQPGWDYTL
jgi:broad specificity phosphatase PhoE